MTAMGESTSDFLVHTLAPQVAVVLGGITFVIALYLEFSKDRYVPWAYWLAAAIAGLVAYLSATGKDTPEEIRAPRARRRPARQYGTAIGEPEPSPEEV